MQDCSINMLFGITIDKRVVVTAASGTLLFFTTIIHESCAVFIPIVIEGQYAFRRTLWMLVFVPPLE